MKQFPNDGIFQYRQYRFDRFQYIREMQNYNRSIQLYYKNNTKWEYVCICICGYLYLVSLFGCAKYTAYLLFGIPKTNHHLTDTLQQNNIKDYLVLVLMNYYGYIVFTAQFICITFAIKPTRVLVVAGVCQYTWFTQTLTNFNATYQFKAEHNKYIEQADMFL